MSIQMLRSLYAHMEWADRRVAQSLHEAPGADETALEQFAHVLAAEQIWLSRIVGRSGSVAVFPRLTLEECDALTAENARAFEAILQRETDATVQRDVEYTDTAGRPHSTRLSDILAHVALHGAYHRGQVAHMVRRGGGVPSATDFIVFVREATATTQAKP